MYHITIPQNEKMHIPTEERLVQPSLCMVSQKANKINQKKLFLCCLEIAVYG